MYVCMYVMGDAVWMAPRPRPTPVPRRKIWIMQLFLITSLAHIDTHTGSVRQSTQPDWSLIRDWLLRGEPHVNTTENVPTTTTHHSRFTCRSSSASTAFFRRLRLQLPDAPRSPRNDIKT